MAEWEGEERKGVSERMAGNNASDLVKKLRYAERTYRLAQRIVAAGDALGFGEMPLPLRRRKKPGKKASEATA